MARHGMPVNCGAREGRKRRGLLGGRNRRRECGRSREVVCASRKDTRDLHGPGARQRLSTVSSVNSRGRRYWMVTDGVLNADRPIEFTGSLIRDVRRKVFPVMDNLRVHHRKPVVDWPEAHQDRIEVFHLPGYSPELNPDGRLNADPKHAITTSVPRRTRQGLHKWTEGHMTMAASTPERVKSYFKDRHVSCAADSQ